MFLSNLEVLIKPDKSNIFFNGFFYSDLNGTAVVIKMFEDENNDGSMIKVLMKHGLINLH